MEVKLLAQVRHDGKNCSKGDVIETSRNEAARLLSLGVAELCKEKDASKIKDNNSAFNKDPRDLELLTKIEIMQELSLRGVSHNARQNKEELLSLLAEAMKEEEEKKGNES